MMTTRNFAFATMFITTLAPACGVKTTQTATLSAATTVAGSVHAKLLYDFPISFFSVGDFNGEGGGRGHEVGAAELRRDTSAPQGSQLILKTYVNEGGDTTARTKFNLETGVIKFQGFYTAEVLLAPPSSSNDSFFAYQKALGFIATAMHYAKAPAEEQAYIASVAQAVSDRTDIDTIALDYPPFVKLGGTTSILIGSKVSTDRDLVLTIADKTKTYTTVRTRLHPASGSKGVWVKFTMPAALNDAGSATYTLSLVDVGTGAIVRTITGVLHIFAPPFE